jgi:hypothetical protein
MRHLEPVSYCTTGMADQHFSISFGLHFAVPCFFEILVIALPTDWGSTNGELHP